MMRPQPAAVRAAIAFSQPLVTTTYPHWGVAEASSGPPKAAADSVPIRRTVGRLFQRVIVEVDRNVHI